MPRAKKSLGQHFLMHPQIAERIARAADLTVHDTVFEIGPGTGMLTRALLARAGRVIALETDPELFESLNHSLKEAIASGKLVLLKGDVQDFDPATLPKGYKLVANIPYYLTGDILRKFLSALNQPAAMTLLVQKEVAARIARAKKGSILSLSVEAYGEPAYEFTVPRGAFRPAPKVDSAVLSVRRISRQHFTDPESEARFFALVRAGFGQKRKRLVKNLENAGFSAAELAPNARAEDLALADWLALLKRA